MCFNYGIATITIRQGVGYVDNQDVNSNRVKMNFHIMQFSFKGKIIKTT